MADIYRNTMVIDFPYAASASAGHMLTTKTPSESRRFHPYTFSGLGNQRKSYTVHNTAGDIEGLSAAASYFPVAMQRASYLPDCQLPGAGALLASALHRQEFLSVPACTPLISYPQTFDMTTLQNLCDPAVQMGTSFENVSRKDRSHPFYCRKRVEPAEGMTRTRDKYRVVYTEKQRRGLEKEYKTNKFITTERKAEISRKLDLSERQVKIWFQNRRAKERRDSRKSKDVQKTDSGKHSEDDNNITDRTSDNLANANFQTSCRFANSNVQPEDRALSYDQCRYTSLPHQSNSSQFCFIESPASCISGYAATPPEKNASTDSSFIPSLHVSPVTGYINFDLASRL